MLFLTIRIILDGIEEVGILGTPANTVPGIAIIGGNWNNNQDQVIGEIGTVTIFDYIQPRNDFNAMLRGCGDLEMEQMLKSANITKEVEI